jgi:MFS family permease
MASKLLLILLLTALACLSQLFRVSNSVLAPEPMRDLDLSARQFGWAGSAFFVALFAMQLSVGCWPPSIRCGSPAPPAPGTARWTACWAVVFGGALISAFFLGALALISQPPLWLAIVLLIAACFFCAFGTVIVAQGRTLFPDRLGGRAVTTVNMAQCLGLTVLPAVTGYIVEALGATDLAYRTVFATLAGGLLLGPIPYARSPDNASR